MAQSDNALFLYRNLADTATASASTEVTGAEAAFSQTIDPGEPWRATGKTSETLSFDHGAAVDMTHACCVHHNLDTDGFIRFVASNNADFSSPVIDTGDLEAWEPVAGFGYDAFGSTLGGYPILTEFNAFVPLRYFDLGGTFSARYSRFVFKNPTNAGITGVSLGYAFVGLGKQFERNMGWDWEIKWVDPSEFIETESSVRVKQRNKHREMMLPMPNITEGEAFSVWDDIKRAVAQSRPIIVFAFPSSGAPKRYRTGIYGIPRGGEGTKNASVRRHSSAITIRELTA